VTIPTTIIDGLIALGQRAVDGMMGDITLLKEHEWINRTAPDSWEGPVGGLATSDVVALIKGLVVIENRLGWMGGSVAAAIWVFRELQGRDPLLAMEVADWILARTRNPYLPFGRLNHGARSLVELRRLDAEYAAHLHDRSQRHLREQSEVAAKAATRRDQRERAKTIHRERHALAARVRRQLIDSLGARSPGVRLQAVALDTDHPVDFYPEAWASLTREEVADLPPDTRARMLKKLANRRKGPWRAFYLALRSLD
jgi:hypothetical protein